MIAKIPGADIIPNNIVKQMPESKQNNYWENFIKSLIDQKQPSFLKPIKNKHRIGHKFSLHLGHKAHFGLKDNQNSNQNPSIIWKPGQNPSIIKNPRQKPRMLRKPRQKPKIIGLNP